MPKEKKLSKRAKEREMMATLGRLRDEYHVLVETRPIAESQELHNQIKSLTQEISNYMSEGAKPCPNEPPRVDDPDLSQEENDAAWEQIRHHVIGLKKTDDPIKGIEVYEVGCLVCKPVLVEEGDILPNGDISERSGRLSMSSRAGSRDAAIEDWNDGIYVIDNNPVI